MIERDRRMSRRPVRERLMVALPLLAALAVPACRPVVAAAQETATTARETAPSPQDPAAPPREVHPEAREAISKIRSPYCPGLMLEVCPSLQAQWLRDSIQAGAVAGLSADSLLEMVIAAHGEEYRAFPKRTGAGLLAWVIPPAALLLGLGLVVVALRRLKGPGGPGVAEDDISEEDRDRLDAALAELEDMEDAAL